MQCVCLHRMSDIVCVTAFAENLVNDGPTPRNGNKSDEAHPPIHPTKYTNSLQVGCT